MSSANRVNRGVRVLYLGLVASFLLPWGCLMSPVEATPARLGDIAIKPGPEVLMGDEISVEITGLPPHQQVVLHARRRDPQNQLWYSHAVYLSDGNGRVSTAESQAVAGDYTGVDPTGLFWSMQVITDTRVLPATLTSLPAESPKHTEVVFDVELGGELVNSGKVETPAMSPDVQLEPVNADGLVAHFYYPTGKKNLPAVIVVGGSEGGIGLADLVACLLASKGYAALALAYSNMPGLPDALQEIPLEYFGKAFDWVGRQEVVNKEKLALFGTSKGAELVLLLGATYPAIKAVVAVSPSDVAWQGLSRDTSSTRSSWTYQGKPVPFVPFKVTDEFNKQFARGMPAEIEYLSLYTAGRTDKDAVRQAVIKVENINGPLLLISGRDDKMWPSEEMCGQIIERLKANGFAHASQHISYDGAGHLLGMPGYIPETRFYFVQGGTPQGNGMAQAALWAASLKFLGESLR